MLISEDENFANEEYVRGEFDIYNIYKQFYLYSNMCFVGFVTSLYIEKDLEIPFSRKEWNL